MTSRVIDTVRVHWLPGAMTAGRFDTTLRAAMWLDAFLSAALALLCAFASPLVAALGLPHGVIFGLGVAAIGASLLLAALGAVTAVAIMRRMSTGEYLLPDDLRLPLPAGMRPSTSGVAGPPWQGVRHDRHES